MLDVFGLHQFEEGCHLLEVYLVQLYALDTHRVLKQLLVWVVDKHVNCIGKAQCLGDVLIFLGRSPGEGSRCLGLGRDLGHLIDLVLLGEAGVRGVVPELFEFQDVGVWVCAALDEDLEELDEGEGYLLGEDELGLL